MPRQVLFITANRLGDAVLSTGLLAHLIDTHRGADLTVACGPLPAPLFRPAPGVGRVIALSKKRFGAHWLELWRQCVGTRWDVVVDLRDGPTSRLLRARERYIWRRAKGVAHKVEEYADVLGITPPPAPRLWFDEDARKAAVRLVPEGDRVLAIGPAANWRRKEWRASNFIQLAERLTAAGGVLPGARVAVVAAATEHAQADPVLQAMAPERRIDLIGRVDPLVAAACLARCHLYVGNDSGIMHMAAAVGIPTLGLFGPSKESVYAPWGAHNAVVRTSRSYEDIIGAPGHDNRRQETYMDSLTVESVEEAAVALWRRCHDGGR